MRKLQAKPSTNLLSQTKRLKQTISSTSTQRTRKILETKKACPKIRQARYMWVYKNRSVKLKNEKSNLCVEEFNVILFIGKTINFFIKQLFL